MPNFYFIFFIRASQRKLTSTTKKLNMDHIDPSIQPIWSDLVSAISNLGGEIEAVSRSAQQSNRDYKAINYQLNSFTP